MKTEETTIKALRLENGDLIIGVNSFSGGWGVSGPEYFVKTSDGIMVYTAGDMEEIYGFVAD